VIVLIEQGIAGILRRARVVVALLLVAVGWRQRQTRGAQSGGEGVDVGGEALLDPIPAAVVQEGLPALGQQLRALGRQHSRVELGGEAGGVAAADAAAELDVGERPAERDDERAIRDPRSAIRESFDTWRWVCSA
jgi:hypothetical protein